MPTEEASRRTDPAYEIRCAELCGLGHTLMVLPVRVVSPQDFEAWAKERSGS